MQTIGSPKFTKDSVIFNGVDNGLRYTTDSQVYKDMNTYGFTAELYYIPHNLSANTDPMGNTNSSGFCFEETGDGKTIEFWVHIGGSYHILKTQINQGELVHLLATYDKENIRLYKNGVLVDTKFSPGNVKEPPHYIFLGGDTNPNGSLEYQSSAEIKIARVYTGYMNDDEAKAAYEKVKNNNAMATMLNANISGETEIQSPKIRKNNMDERPKSEIYSFKAEDNGLFNNRYGEYDNKISDDGYLPTMYD